MSTELKGPSVTYLKKLITNRIIVDIKLLNGDLLSGNIVWNDHYAILLKQNDDKEIMILMNSIAYVSKKD